jgi:hypothetical protein
MSSLRWIPRATIAVAVLHLVYAVVLYYGVYRDMVADGLVGSVADHDDREAALWFLVAAPALAALGATAEWAVRRTGELPAPVGVGLVAIGALITVADPISGGWLVLGLGVGALVVRRRRVARPATGQR